MDAVGWHSSIAERFHGRYHDGRMFRERTAVWKDAMSRWIPAGAEVADLGCGSGVLAKIASPMARKVTGIDGSPEMVRIAQEFLREHGCDNVEVKESRLEGFRSVCAGSFGAILCSSVIEYLPRPFEFLANVFAALDDDGVLLLSAPNGASWYRALERTIYRLSGRPRYLRYARTHESAQQVSELLVKSGFRVVEVRSFGLPPIISAPFRALGCARLAHTMVLFVAAKGMGKPK